MSAYRKNLRRPLPKFAKRFPHEDYITYCNNCLFQPTPHAFLHSGLGYFYSSEVVREVLEKMVLGLLVALPVESVLKDKL